MPLDSHSASGAACWGFPPSPHERRISFCCCASVGRFEPCPGLPLGMVFFLFCIVFRLHIQQTIHIGLCRQQLPHFFTGAPIFGIGFFLFLQNLGILGL